MQYSPKLKKAMEEIKEVLNKYDIAGSIVIQEPGFSEYLLKIDPSYSCAKIEGAGRLRVKSKLVDYNGDKEAQSLSQAQTSNMLALLAETSTGVGAMLKKASEQVDWEMETVHTKGEHTSSDQQNN